MKKKTCNFFKDCPFWYMSGMGKKHKKDCKFEDCKFAKAVKVAVPIECEHGYDVCPICDPCKCKVKSK